MPRRLCLLVLSLALLAAGARADTWSTISEAVYPMVAAGELAMALDGREGRQAALQGLEALAASGAATQVLKWSVRERRPDRSDFDSFPSLHAATAFTMAEVVRQYDRHWAPYAYAGAVLIATARVQADKHYWHDVLAGAALGYVSGHYLARHHVSVTPTSIAFNVSF